MSSELIHRLHFAFTITFHYLFPQLTMGLGLLIVVLKSVALKTGGNSLSGAPVPLCLPHHIPLLVSPTHHGAWPTDCGAQVGCAQDWRRTVGPGSAILGTHLRHQLCLRRAIHLYRQVLSC